MEHLGTGIGWRPEIAGMVAELPAVDWVEAVAENLCPDHLPEPLLRLRERGITVIPHGVSLGLGGADRPDPARLAALATRAGVFGSPLVTEHVAFVRAGGPLTASPRLEAGHLLPVPRTRDALDVLCENVRIAQEALPVPLALENVAALVAWPGEELTEEQFLTELVERTGVRLLIDVANLHTNHVNRGEDPATVLDGLPLEAVAYVHVAGGLARDGVWHDTHAHPVPQGVLDVLAEFCARTTPPGTLLERDDNFPAASELAAELDAIRAVAASRPATAPPSAGGGAPPHPAAGAAGIRQAAPAVPGLEQQATGAPAGRSGTHTAGPRQRLALMQAALLSALVSGTPAPEGFDRRRLRIQSRALAAKRADIVAKMAPELPEILGPAYRSAFLAYARSRPLTGGHRGDALDFAEHLLSSPAPAPAAATRTAADSGTRRGTGTGTNAGARTGTGTGTNAGARTGTGTGTGTGAGAAAEASTDRSADGDATTGDAAAVVADPAVRRRLDAWWRERAEPAAPPPPRLGRLLRRALRTVPRLAGAGGSAARPASSASGAAQQA